MQTKKMHANEKCCNNQSTQQKYSKPAEALQVEQINADTQVPKNS